MDTKIIRSLTQYAKRDEIIGLHIAYIENGQLTQYSYGHTDRSKQLKLDSQSLFEIGSITKPIIATLATTLASQNFISLDKSVSYYLKEDVHPIFNEIMIRDILSHRSGLPRLPSKLDQKMTDLQDPYSCLQYSDLYEYLNNPTELGEPGEYVYSNLGYGILGEILKAASSKSLQEIGDEFLFAKVGMLRTGSIHSYRSDLNICQGYNFANNETQYWHNDVLAGAGSFLSCGDDMAKFLIANLNDQYKGLNETHKIVYKDIGLGWHIKNGLLSKIFGFNGFIWHNGMTGGFSSFICFNKKKNAGLVLLANKTVSLESYFYNFASFFLFK